MKYDKRRYIFIVKYNNKISAHSYALFFKQMFGEIMMSKCSLKVIYEEKTWFVLRVSHICLPYVRSATVIYGTPGDLYTLVVSGSISGLIRSLEARSEGKIYGEQLRQVYRAQKRRFIRTR
ncbi:MAG TPA: hypothetical protein VKV31_00980 [bacterium]|nr:hypothetical protein [bacterium]